MTARAHSFRIPDAVWADVTVRAEGDGTSATAILLDALAAYLAAPAGNAGGLSDDDARLAREQFSKGAACMHCGGIHLRACPRVRRIAWRNKEDLAEVEYWPAGRWDPGDTVFPEDVFPDDGSSALGG